MIIYGWGSTNVGNRKSTSATCPNCKEQGNIIHSIFSKHAHIFWIPFFPYGKLGVSQCQSCGFTMEGKKQMPDDVLRESNELKSDSRPAIWQFIGLILIGVVAIVISVQGEIDKNEELGFVAEPLAGDVCEYKTEDNDYSIFRIVEVTSDSLVVLYNDYVSDRSTSLHQLNKDSCFTNLYFVISRKEFEGMHADGTIYGILRD